MSLLQNKQLKKNPMKKIFIILHLVLAWLNQSLNCLNKVAVLF